MARVSLISTLPAMRAVYEKPRDMTRFRAYLDLLKGDSDDVAVPVGSFNPMAKPRVLAHVDDLLAMDAEGIARAACAEAEPRVEGAWRVALQLADDVAGGWTDRYLTDAAWRFEGAGEVKRGFATALLWVSETPSPALVRARVLAAVARRERQRVQGDPRTLRDMLAQEADAQRVAGVERAPPLPDAQRETMARHLDATLFATRFAAFYGDAAATRAGYPPLGLPEFAGLRYA